MLLRFLFFIASFSVLSISSLNAREFYIVGNFLAKPKLIDGMSVSHNSELSESLKFQDFLSSGSLQNRTINSFFQRRNHLRWLAQGNQQNVEKQNRTALVIGNANYQSDKLDNPVNDAQDVAVALERLGFDVTLVVDADQEQMETAVESFSRRLNVSGGVGLFYYSGKAIQVEQINYLVPLKAKINRDLDFRYRAVPLEWILDVMGETQNDTNIVILEPNPYLSRTRGLYGLGLTQSTGSTLIAYSVQGGGFPLKKGRNSLFTSNLLQYIAEPNLPVELMFKKVREAVVEQSNGEQVPFISSSPFGTFFFNQATTNNPDNNSTITSITSAVTGINYSSLRNWLALGNWKEADKKTNELLRAMGDKNKDNIIDQFEAKELSCFDLELIDQLWMQYSGGIFGFGMQKKIFEEMNLNDKSLNDSLQEFAPVVGWTYSKNNTTIDFPSFDDFPNDFYLLTSKGHLPSANSFVSFIFSGCNVQQVFSSSLPPHDSEINTHSEVDLKTERGLDYSKLRDLLAAEKWREADEETKLLILQAVRRDWNRFMPVEEIENFPCQDLITINQLWLVYSKGRYGISTQRDIYESMLLKKIADSEGKVEEDKFWIDFLIRVNWNRFEQNQQLGELYFTNPDALLPAAYLSTGVPIKLNSPSDERMRKGEHQDNPRITTLVDARDPVFITNENWKKFGSRLVTCQAIERNIQNRDNLDF